MKFRFQQIFAFLIFVIEHSSCIPRLIYEAERFSWQDSDFSRIVGVGSVPGSVASMNLDLALNVNIYMTGTIPKDLDYTLLEIHFIVFSLFIALIFAYLMNLST